MKLKQATGWETNKRYDHHTGVTFDLDNGDTLRVSLEEALDMAAIILEAAGMDANKRDRLYYSLLDTLTVQEDVA